MKHARSILCSLLLSLSALPILSFADGDISDSTTTGSVNVISGEDVGGASGAIKNARIVITDFKKAFNGGYAGAYHIVWPYIYYGGSRYCNISSGVCSYGARGSFTLDVMGIYHRPYMGATTQAASTTLYRWTK